MKKICQIGMALLLAGSIAPLAQAQMSKVGYLTDKSGNIITSKTTGHCIRTKHWTPENADAACRAKMQKK